VSISLCGETVYSNEASYHNTVIVFHKFSLPRCFFLQLYSFWGLKSHKEGSALNKTTGRPSSAHTAEKIASILASSMHSERHSTDRLLCFACLTKESDKFFAELYIAIPTVKSFN
jgi:hypothetical protein